METAGALKTLDWAADALQSNPAWVTIALGCGVVVVWGARIVEKRWQCERELETERARATLQIETARETAGIEYRRDWLRGALEAARDEDSESFIRLACAMGWAHPNGETGAEDCAGSGPEPGQSHIADASAQSMGVVTQGNAVAAVHGDGGPVDRNERAKDSRRHERATITNHNARATDR